MKNFLIILSSLVLLNVNAQDQDIKAKAILDDLSKTTKSYKTITTDFVLTMFNKDKKQIEKQTGKVVTKGLMFKLDIPGNTIMCDGKTIWNHNKDAKEVTIKTFDATNNDQLNPSKIFTIYESGFKYKYIAEEKVGAVVCHAIDLYPTVDQGKKKYHSIKIYVDKTKKQVVQMKIMMKDQSTNVYDIKGLKPNLPVDDKAFIFDTKLFKPDQIIDERD
ncbi:MAG: outer membrane lipoprotein carrier protein LolA [Bacteroidota bacterium]|nr:outer membrane lipoprotein carrier protein LolA [Bacteroidota bacterium]